VSQISPHRAVARKLELVHGAVAVLDVAAGGTETRRGGRGARRGTVVLVPGYTGSKEDFNAVLDTLADAGHRVVALDQPGQHQSPGPDPDAPEAYTVGWLASVVADVVARVVAEDATPAPVHLLGHSFGGLVARAAVIADPGAYRSLVLLGSGPAAIGGPRTERMAALEPLLASGGMAAVYAGMEEMARYDRTWRAAPQELRDFLRDRFVVSSAAGLKGMGDALLTEPDRVEELRATGVPVLVMYGEADDAWRPRTQARMAERLGARREVVAGAVHSPAAEQPAATAKVLLDFWAAVEEGTA